MQKRIMIQGMHQDNALHMTKDAVSMENRTILRQYISQCSTNSKTGREEEQSTKSAKRTSNIQWGKKVRTEALMG